MIRVTWLVAGMAALCSQARADALHATREQPLFEVSHTVDIRVEDGVAIYKVRRQFANPGKVADEAGLAIDLPYGAAATGLRLRAHDVWYDGELMERDKAAALYHELTGLGAYRPKDPALLQWIWADKLYLQVFPVMPGQVSTVEYTLTVPTRYVGGRYFVSYPRIEASASVGTDRDGATLHLATPIVTVHPSWGDALTPIFVDNQRAAVDTPIVLVPPPRQPWQDTVHAEGGASYVASAIEIPASSHTSKTFATAKITFDIRHTYRSDLKVELVTPEGTSIVLHDRKGGGDNDLKGTRELQLPPGTHGAGTWRLVVSDHAALDTGTLDSWQLDIGDTTAPAKDTPVFIPDAPEYGSDAGVASIAIAPPHLATWTARLGRVVASPEHAFARLEIDVAPQLVPTPKRAQVVFAVDASFSVGSELLDAQLAVIRAYLTHLPDAEVELVVYRRRAQRLFGRFVPAAEVDAALAGARARGALALGNGSALDDAAKLAGTLLADRRGPRRLVIATDELVRSSLTKSAALASLAALPADVVVHVIVPEADHDDRPSLSRDDGHDLAPLATRHHGIFARIHGLPVETIKTLAPTVLELVRPTRIESFTVAGVKVDDTVLHEGDGVRVMVLDKAAPARVVLAGKLWSDPIRREVDATEAFSRQTAAFVFGADEHQTLSQAEQLKVAMYGRAVSPVTSYVAFEPGTRPSPIGLEWGFGRSGFGPGGGGSGYGSGSGTSLKQPDFAKLVDASACVRQVKPAAGWSVHMSVETTKDEIVDVTAVDATQPMAACLIETVWAIRLDSRFVFQRDTFDFTLGG
jgi:subtilisin-like proprotein convertase family protein